MANPKSSGRRLLRDWLLPLFLLSPLLFHVDACDPLSEEEFMCEEAGAQIRKCCGAVRGLNCLMRGGGDCHYSRPDLLGRTASCIQDASCDQLVAAGACQVNNWSDTSASCAGISSPACAVLEALSCL